ncbi:MAG TPA: GTPase, partial [Gemmatimonadales bacterium]|nr:GTPase [Gemmatimonadales bacterium]
KSSLFNALVGSERALVTEVPGTTRDAVEAGTTCDGWPVRLIDTAGLQDATERLDRLGVEVSRRYLGAADVVLLCVEGPRALEGEECELAGDLRTIVVRTKGDVQSQAAADAGAEVRTSAVTGQGLDALRRAIARRAFAGGEDALEPLLLRERHRDALGKALAELDEAGRHLVPRGDAVLAAHHLGAAVAALEELLGSVTTDEVLAQVFAGFCVGK